jgi:hypothetical protein
MVRGPGGRRNTRRNTAGRCYRSSRCAPHTHRCGAQGDVRAQIVMLDTSGARSEVRQESDGDGGVVTGDIGNAGLG